MVTYFYIWTLVIIMVSHCWAKTSISIISINTSITSLELFISLHFLRYLLRSLFQSVALVVSCSLPTFIKRYTMTITRTLIGYDSVFFGHVFLEVFITSVVASSTHILFNPATKRFTPDDYRESREHLVTT